MAKVVHIRGVSDEVHDALVEAAEAEGLSLTRYVQRELEHVATRARVVRHNAEVVRQGQRSVWGSADRDTILSLLQEGRDE